jgi:hypothetical protein
VKAPSDTAQHADPITADELSEIFTSILKRKGDQPPAPAELSALAAALTGMRFRYLNPDENIVVFDLATQQRLALRRPFGMPSPRMIAPRDFTRNWHDLAPDMVAEFRRAGPKLNNKALARFLKKVIPRITGEKPSAATIGQELKQPYQRKRPRTRAR